MRSFNAAEIKAILTQLNIPAESKAESIAQVDVWAASILNGQETIDERQLHQILFIHPASRSHNLARLYKVLDDTPEEFLSLWGELLRVGQTLNAVLRHPNFNALGTQKRCNLINDLFATFELNDSTAVDDRTFALYVKLKYKGSLTQAPSSFQSEGLDLQSKIKTILNLYSTTPTAKTGPAFFSPSPENKASDQALIEAKESKPFTFKISPSRVHEWIPFSKSEEKRLVSLLEEAAKEMSEHKSETKSSKLQSLLDGVDYGYFERIPEIVEILGTANIIKFEHFYPSEPALKVLFDILASNPKTILPSALGLDLSFGGYETPLYNLSYLQNLLKHNRSIEYLSPRDIGDNGAVMLAKYLEENETVNHLKLNYCKIADVGANALIALLQKNKTMQILDLSRNKISDGGVRAIEQLHENTQSKLRILDLDSNEISADGATHLAKAYLKNPNPLSIYTRLNPIGDVGVKAFISAYKIKLNKSQEFDFTNYAVLGSENFKELANLLQDGFNVTTIEICANENSMPGFAAFTEALARNSTLKKLTIQCQGLNQLMAKKLGLLLSVNNSIESLVLGDSRIGDENMQFIIDGLVSNQGITDLDLSNNALTGNSAKKLKALFDKNKNLQNCNLRVNRIDDSGAKLIAEGLASNKSLLSLDMTHNQFGAEGIISIAGAVANNTRLRRLKISNQSSKALGSTVVESKAVVGKALQQMVLRNHSLVYFDARNAGLSQADLGVLLPAFKNKSNFEEVILDRAGTDDANREQALDVIQHNPRIDLQVDLIANNGPSNQFTNLGTRVGVLKKGIADQRFVVYRKRLLQILNIFLNQILYVVKDGVGIPSSASISLINQYAQSDKESAYPKGWQILERQPPQVFEKTLALMVLLRESVGCLLQEEPHIISIIEDYAGNDWEGISPAV